MATNRMVLCYSEYFGARTGTGKYIKRNMHEKRKKFGFARRGIHYHMHASTDTG